jgi:hypothetical protein
MFKTVWAVGDRVRIERDEKLYPSKGTWPQFRGKTGTIVEINLGEYGVVIGGVRPRTDGRGRFRWSGPVTWFRDYELRTTGKASGSDSDGLSDLSQGQVPDKENTLYAETK